MYAEFGEGKPLTDAEVAALKAAMKEIENHNAARLNPQPQPVREQGSGKKHGVILVPGYGGA